MFGVEFMTEAERKGTLAEIKSLEEACKVDADEVLRAASDFDADLSLCVHINMLKCEVLRDMKKILFRLKPKIMPRFVNSTPKNNAERNLLKL